MCPKYKDLLWHILKFRKKCKLVPVSYQSQHRKKIFSFRLNTETLVPVEKSVVLIFSYGIWLGIQENKVFDSRFRKCDVIEIFVDQFHEKLRVFVSHLTIPSKMQTYWEFQGRKCYCNSHTQAVILENIIVFFVYFENYKR